VLPIAEMAAKPSINKPRPRKINQRQAARILHVSHEHLNRVIKGKWKNPQLLALYRDLIARHSNPKPSTKH
jgi:predicted XRE-type DNA-binding protein